MKNQPIYFYSHDPSSYSKDKPYYIFSQWYIEPFIGKKAIYDTSDVISSKFVYGFIFNCREKWMMANKALLFASEDKKMHNMYIYYQIMKSKSPKKIKALGRKVAGFDGDIWKQWRYKIVTNGNYLQFSQNERFKKILLDTGIRPLAEASPYDKIWGLGLSVKQASKIRYKDWNKFGLNLLGKALMEVRDALRS